MSYILTSTNGAVDIVSSGLHIEIETTMLSKVEQISVSSPYVHHTYDYLLTLINDCRMPHVDLNLLIP